MSSPVEKKRWGNALAHEFALFHVATLRKPVIMRIDELQDQGLRCWFLEHLSVRRAPIESCGNNPPVVLPELLGGG